MPTDHVEFIHEDSSKDPHDLALETQQAFLVRNEISGVLKKFEIATPPEKFLKVVNLAREEITKRMAEAGMELDDSDFPRVSFLKETDRESFIEELAKHHYHVDRDSAANTSWWLDGAFIFLDKRCLDVDLGGSIFEEIYHYIGKHVLVIREKAAENRIGLAVRVNNQQSWVLEEGIASYERVLFLDQLAKLPEFQDDIRIKQQIELSLKAQKLLDSDGMIQGLDNTKQQLKYLIPVTIEPKSDREFNGLSPINHGAGSIIELLLSKDQNNELLNLMRRARRQPPAIKEMAKKIDELWEKETYMKLLHCGKSNEQVWQLYQELKRAQTDVTI